MKWERRADNVEEGGLILTREDWSLQFRVFILKEKSIAEFHIYYLPSIELKLYEALKNNKADAHTLKKDDSTIHIREQHPENEGEDNNKYYRESQDLLKIMSLSELVLYHEGGKISYHMNLDSETWYTINKFITAIESLDAEKNSLKIAKNFLMHNVSVPQPYPLLSHALHAVQRQIDSGNKAIEEAARNHLPAELKERIRFSDYKLLRHKQRFEGILNDDRNLHLQHPELGLMPPIYDAKMTLKSFIELYPSSEHIPEMKKKFKERFNIDYEKALTMDDSHKNEPPKDKGGSTPGCVIS